MKRLEHTESVRLRLPTPQKKSWWNCTSVLKQERDPEYLGQKPRVCGTTKGQGRTGVGGGIVPQRSLPVGLLGF